MNKNIYTKSLKLILAVAIGIFGLTFFSSLDALAQTTETELTEKQKQLDINGDGEIDSEDLQRLRNGEKPKSVEAAPQ